MQRYCTLFIYPLLKDLSFSLNNLLDDSNRASYDEYNDTDEVRSCLVVVINLRDCMCKWYRDRILYSCLLQTLKKIIFISSYQRKFAVGMCYKLRHSGVCCIWYLSADTKICLLVAPYVSFVVHKCCFMWETYHAIVVYMLLYII